jgi:hypothetical protein
VSSTAIRAISEPSRQRTTGALVSDGTARWERRVLRDQCWRLAAARRAVRPALGRAAAPARGRIAARRHPHALGAPRTPRRRTRHRDALRQPPAPRRRHGRWHLALEARGGVSGEGFDALWGSIFDWVAGPVSAPEAVAAAQQCNASCCRGAPSACRWPGGHGSRTRPRTAGTWCLVVGRAGTARAQREWMLRRRMGWR